MQNLSNKVSIIHKQAKKTRKGWLGNKVRQVHLRDDIQSGIQQFLNQQDLQQQKQSMTQQNTNISMYFLDTNTIIQQTDIIYNCPQLNNLVFLQSSIQKLKKNSIHKYNAFKNHLQVQAVGQQDNGQINQNQRKYIVFADIYHKQINQSVKNRIQLLQQISQNDKQWINLQCCAQWYLNKAQQIKLKLDITILTTNQKYIKKNQTSLGIKIISLVQFLKQRDSSMLDYIGFTSLQQQMDVQAIFQQHIQSNDAKKKIKQGKLFQGKYMIQKSYFKIGHQMHKIILQNNRALFGDVIAIQLLPVQKWQNRSIKVFNIGEQQQQIQQKQKNQFQVDTISQGNLQMIKILRQNKNLIPKGKIKSIIKRNIKDYCGSIDSTKIVKSSPSGWSMYNFIPADSRFPQFLIRTFNPQALIGKRIQIAYDSWPCQSQKPLCHFLKIIGNAGDSRTQGDVILLQHNVQIKQFSRKAYQCLPKSGAGFVIPKQQQQYRLDLRHLNVCSIDPPGCKDIDDALHCIRLQNGNLQIGVHIADVSYYVRPDSALDMQARNRCTTVYLADRRTDMLPKLLTQNLCSLRADVDRLAFSTIWQIDENANIINTKYTKSIIRSRKAYTYMQAQQLMQSDSNSQLAVSVRNLNKIAKLLKKKRLDLGALTLASTQVKITLQQQTHSATDVQLYQLVQANYLIQQFMLLANISVAQKIYERFPSISILRRHTQPKVTQLQGLRQILSFYGYQLHYQNSKALAQSLDKIQKKGDPFFNKLIRILTTRCMNQATYFCSADFDPQQFFHYGLAAPFYTHFTSPIRRYADVLVHRLLAAAIDLQPLPNFMINKLKMTKICQKMNLRNRMARYASRASSDYHTYQFFKNKDGQLQQGVITAISGQKITIMLVKYGLQCKYELNQNQSKKTIQLNKGQGIYNMVNIKQKDRKLFQYCKVSVNVKMQGFHKKITIDIK